MENEDQTMSVEAAPTAQAAPQPVSVKTQSHTGDVMRSYSFEFKLQAIEYSNRHNVNAASRKFNVDDRRIREWKRQEAKIRAQMDTGGPAAKKAKRLSGGGRKLVSADLESALYDYFATEREKNNRVTRKRLTAKGLEILNLLKRDEKIADDTKLNISRGYITGFMDRNHLTLRRTTTAAQKPPDDFVEKIIKYFMYIRKLRAQHKFEPFEMFAADETAVWPDGTPATCIEQRGAKDVQVRTTGHEKLRMTVMLCAKASGGKCLPFVLIPRKRPIPALDKKFAGKLILVYCGKNWMDNDITKTFLKQVIGPFSFSKKPKMLSWDSFRCHISSDVKAELKRLNIKSVVVPGGCTKYTQAPDVSWNGPFKAKWNELHDEWMTNGKKEFTKSGNMRAPDLDLILSWIVESWKVVTPEMIRKSFKICGLTASTDGSDDQELYFFKHYAPTKLHELSEANRKRQDEDVIVIDEHGLDQEETEETSDDENGGVESDASVDFDG